MPGLSPMLNAATAVTNASTLPALLSSRIARSPEGEAYRAFDSAVQCWRSLTWAQAGIRVAHWRDALAAMALPAGARVSILLPNGLDAMSIDQAVMALGMVPVPLHAIDNPGSIAYILGDCAASLLVVEKRRQWDAIVGTGVVLPVLRAVVVTGEISPGAEEQSRLPAAGVQVHALADWLAAGIPSAHLPGPAAEDLAAIVYTSGTTGKPKGVKLTHRNVVANVNAVLGRVVPSPDDLFLSFLPLSHTFERTVGYYLPIASGSCVAYARSVALLAEDLLSQRPTVLISVPRIYELVHAKLQEVLAASPLKAWLMAKTQTLGWRRFRAAQGLVPDESGRPGLLDKLLWPLLSRLVAEPVLKRFGGRVRVAVSGGAAIPPAVARAFLGLGLPILQGYGMTETSPVVSANGIEDNDPASVGRPLPGVEVRIGENHELQVRGPSVMQGYWNRDVDTPKVLGADGWLNTGDQAEILDGRIYIRGRIKEIIVTSTGEKVPPVDLELALCEDPLIEQAFVVGEHKPFIGAVVVLNAKEWRRLASSLGLDWQAPASLQTASAREAVLARLTARTANFPRYAVPRAVVLSMEPWTVENVMLTPTLKLKRLNLMVHFEAELMAMYAPR
jgi:long-chain acyl-CoA synthetase